MGVYIKGMEMPDGCYYCPFRQGSFGRVPPHRAMCMVTGEVMPVDEKNIQHNQPCPLVPVPPHGRLIDIDAPYQIRVHVDGLTKKGGVDIYAPAVLDADPAEEGE